MTPIEAKLARGIGGHHMAAPQTVEWLTPPSIIDALGGAQSFDLDPCSPAVRPWSTAQQHYTRQDNGLLKPWHGRVWLNPPYTTAELVRWLGKMHHHGTGTALIFARTETEAFFAHVWGAATALLFIEGRLNFHVAIDTWYRPKGGRAQLVRAGEQYPANSGAPSVLIAYGMHDCDVLAACPIEGQFVPLRIPRSVLVEALATASEDDAALATPWRAVIAALLADSAGPMRLDELYRAVANHPKARGNRHVEAKVRQVLQQGAGRRTGRGQWQSTLF